MRAALEFLFYDFLCILSFCLLSFVLFLFFSFFYAEEDERAIFGLEEIFCYLVMMSVRVAERELKGSRGLLL